MAIGNAKHSSKLIYHRPLLNEGLSHEAPSVLVLGNPHSSKSIVMQKIISKLYLILMSNLKCFTSNIYINAFNMN